jgi:hypothetical protein
MAIGKAFAVHSSELYGAKATAGDDGLCHLLTFDFEGSGEPPATLTLHPWNHAPREPAARALGDFADDWLLLLNYMYPNCKHEPEH